MESVFQLDLEDVNFQETPIYKAITSINDRQLLFCLQTGQNAQEKDEDFGTTYLHTVLDNVESCTEELYVPMVYLLSNAGVDVNASDYKGRTALHRALSKNLSDMVIALIRCGAECNPTVDRMIIAESNSPFELEVLHWYQKFEPGLWAAVEKNDPDLTERLIRSWCRIRIKRDHSSLIRFARENNRKRRIIELLEQNKATLEFVHATLAGDGLRMEELLSNRNIDVYIKDVSYQPNCLTIGYPRSLRETAADMMYTHVLRLLPIVKSSNENYWRFVKRHVLNPIANNNFQNEHDRRNSLASSLPDESLSTPILTHADGVITYQNISKISRVLTEKDCTRQNLKEKEEMEPSTICIIM